MERVKSVGWERNHRQHVTYLATCDLPKPRDLYNTATGKRASIKMVEDSGDCQLTVSNAGFQNYYRKYKLNSPQMLK